MRGLTLADEVSMGVGQFAIRQGEHELEVGERRWEECETGLLKLGTTFLVDIQIQSAEPHDLSKKVDPLSRRCFVLLSRATDRLNRLITFAGKHC